MSKNNSLNLEFLLSALSESLSDSIAEKVSERITKTETSISNEIEFLGVKDSMSFLKIKSRATLRSYIKSGQLPEPTKAGGRKLIFKKSDLINFLSYGK
jgi:hypothetical protein